MEVKWYRSPKPGPETALVEHIISWLAESKQKYCYNWLGCEKRVGAGIPDILFASHEVEKRNEGFDKIHARVLAYLRSVRAARDETIASRINSNPASVSEAVACLHQEEVVDKTGNAFSVSSTWKRGIPNLISIEAKVSDYKTALKQASHNLMFSYRSYVALPEAVARRTMDVIDAYPEIGVLSIADSGKLKTMKAARSKPPRLWFYHFQVALEIVSS